MRRIPKTKTKKDPVQLVLAAIRKGFAEIQTTLEHDHQHQITMSAQLDKLTTEVEESKTIQQSAITLIRGLAEQIRNAGDDPAKLEALADDLDRQSTALASAVEENTPSGA